MERQFKTVHLFGKYYVSEQGDIYSTHFGWDKLKARLNNRGYLRVLIPKNGIVKERLVHRLVAGAFIENPLAKPEVHHINGDTSDNRVANLMWVTHLENMNDGNPVIEGTGLTPDQENLVTQLIYEMF